MTEDNIIDPVANIAVIIILIATLGVSAFSIIGSQTMLSNYSEPIRNLTAPSTIYLTNSELKANTLSIYNATFGAAVTTDYTVVESSGIITIPGNTRLLNGTAYSLTYQKDSVSSIVKTLVITVISIIGAIAFIIIIVTRLKK